MRSTVVACFAALSLALAGVLGVGLAVVPGCSSSGTAPPPADAAAGARHPAKTGTPVPADSPARAGSPPQTDGEAQARAPRSAIVGGRGPGSLLPASARVLSAVVVGEDDPVQPSSTPEGTPTAAAPLHGQRFAAGQPLRLRFVLGSIDAAKAASATAGVASSAVVLRGRLRVRGPAGVVYAADDDLELAVPARGSGRLEGGLSFAVGRGAPAGAYLAEVRLATAPSGELELRAPFALRGDRPPATSATDGRDGPALAGLRVAGDAVAGGTLLVAGWVAGLRPAATGRPRQATAPGAAWETSASQLVGEVLATVRAELLAASDGPGGRGSQRPLLSLPPLRLREALPRQVRSTVPFLTAAPLPATLRPGSYRVRVSFGGGDGGGNHPPAVELPLRIAAGRSGLFSPLLVDLARQPRLFLDADEPFVVLADATSLAAPAEIDIALLASDGGLYQVAHNVAAIAAGGVRPVRLVLRAPRYPPPGPARIVLGLRQGRRQVAALAIPFELRAEKLAPLARLTLDSLVLPRPLPGDRPWRVQARIGGFAAPRAGDSYRTRLRPALRLRKLAGVTVAEHLPGLREARYGYRPLRLDIDETIDPRPGQPGQPGRLAPGRYALELEVEDAESDRSCLLRRVVTVE